MSPAADAACQHGCTVADTVNKSCEEKVCHNLYNTRSVCAYMSVSLKDPSIYLKYLKCGAVKERFF